MEHVKGDEMDMDDGKDYDDEEIADESSDDSDLEEEEREEQFALERRVVEIRKEVFEV